LVVFLPGNHVKSCHQQTMRYGDQRPFLATPSRQAVIQPREILGLAAGGTVRRLHQGTPQPDAALACLATLALAATLVVPRTYACPRRQMLCIGKLLQVG